MFLQVSVCPQVGGGMRGRGCAWHGGVYMAWGACMAGGVHGMGGMCGMGVCMAGGACVVGGCMPCMPPLLANTTRYSDTINEWAVRILLECILVPY